jgi:hypothetical protein
MAAGSTYTPIATTTLGSNQNDITFSSIPSTYTDLVIVFTGNSTNTGSSSNGMRCRVNSDTGTNYSTTYLNGDGSTASSSRATSTAYFEVGEIAQTSNTSPTVTIIQIMNYANSTTYKTILARVNTATVITQATVSLWRSTSAINSVTLSRDFGTNQLKVGSTATLYGIASA